jgi:hypothetical protein
VVNLKTFPKPYSCELSKKYPVDLVFEETPILTVQCTPNKIHQRIADALNGAYLEGYLQKERELDMII